MEEEPDGFSRLRLRHCSRRQHNISIDTGSKLLQDLFFESYVSVAVVAELWERILIQGYPVFCDNIIPKETDSSCCQYHRWLLSLSRVQVRLNTSSRYWELCSTEWMWIESWFARQDHRWSSSKSNIICCHYYTIHLYCENTGRDRYLILLSCHCHQDSGAWSFSVSPCHLTAFSLLERMYVFTSLVISDFLFCFPPKSLP
jgi:hypothetical protein